MSALPLHKSESESPVAHTSQPDDEDTFSHGVSRARAMTFGAVGAAVAVGVAGGVAYAQAEQRNDATRIATENAQQEQEAADAYQDSITEAINKTYDQADVVGPTFTLESNNSIYGNALTSLDTAGVKTSEIDLGPLDASSKQLASKIPQPKDSFAVVDTDINGDGVKEPIVVPENHISQQ